MITDSPPVKSSSAMRRRSLVIEGVIVVAIALLILFGAPQFLTAIGQEFRINMLGRFMALAIVALGIDLIWGYTGMLSLGHGIFFSLGGYALAMFLQLQLPEGQLPEFFTLFGVDKLPWFWQPFHSLPFTLMAIVFIPATIAGLLGYLVFRNRIRGVYFSILTQASLIVFFNFFNSQQKLINGTNGLKTDTTKIFGVYAGSDQAQSVFYTLTVLFLVLAYFLCRWLTSGRLGRLLIAIRDDESRVRFSGYDPTGFKVLVFAVSAGLAGMAGALYTVQSGIISPKTMDIAFSIEMVIWVAVGGRASLIGAILGALIVNFARSILTEQFPEIWLFFQGALFLVVVTVLPGGFIGWLRNEGQELFRSLIGRPRRVMTYPSLSEDPEVEYERQNLRN
ncbi:urea ABC transporter permease subunit UrtC [Acaryochloris sp. 'Moss Beach']|uniref:urea ABC transporter permease subunit UrtC n=1 Tax=Acaryochloris sp. 'Moss Beach' TaxID=2740837 RepID=UPI001F2C85F1|nr:urea ABC transporter permease subunit UrtC [Acaryochloris sp. 'Moss Beach']UJB70053.1 urea ABC transporter permease subunit UrtC [Acaryochloris sp. 'Moss Beach']